MLTVELMLAEATLIGNLVRNKLCVMASSNTLVDDLILLEALLDGGVLELSHFGVVREHVQRQVFALSDRDEFILIVVLIGVLLILDIDEESFVRARALKSGERGD